MMPECVADALILAERADQGTVDELRRALAWLGRLPLAPEVAHYPDLITTELALRGSSEKE